MKNDNFAPQEETISSAESSFIAEENEIKNKISAIRKEMLHELDFDSKAKLLKFENNYLTLLDVFGRHNLAKGFALGLEYVENASK